MPKLPKSKSKKWIASSNTKVYKRKVYEYDEFYNSAQWSKLRKWYRQRNPVCVWCMEENTVNAKDKIIIDHIIELQDGGERLDPNNLQTLCLKHHNQKTAWARNKRRKK